VSEANTVADERVQGLEELSRRLEEGARRLREEDLAPDDAIRLAGECAELASQAAVELDRLARTSSPDSAEVSGQEELL
jgi:hypothetical protein